jgi:hypothetical protein
MMKKLHYKCCYQRFFLQRKKQKDERGGQNMIQWEHRYLLGTMVFTIAGDVVRDFDEEYEAWSWLEQEGWGLVAIEPPDPIRPGTCKYYFKRQKPAQYMATRSTTTDAQVATNYMRRERR